MSKTQFGKDHRQHKIEDITNSKKDNSKGILKFCLNLWNGTIF